MSDEKNSLSLWTVSLIALIIAGTGTTGLTLNEVLSSEDYSHHYACTATGNIEVFDRISGTGLTGYPSPTSRAGGKRCYDDKGDNSYWQPLKDYAETKGLDMNSLIETSKEQEPTKEPEPETPIIVIPAATGNYKCSPPPNYGCVRIS